MPFPDLWPGLLLSVMRESLFCRGLSRRGGELPTSCWQSLPDPTHIKVFLFAAGRPKPALRAGGLGSDFTPSEGGVHLEPCSGSTWETLVLPGRLEKLSCSGRREGGARGGVSALGVYSKSFACSTPLMARCHLGFPSLGPQTVRCPHGPCGAAAERGHGKPGSRKASSQPNLKSAGKCAGMCGSWSSPSS